MSAYRGTRPTNSVVTASLRRPAGVVPSAHPGAASRVRSAAPGMAAGVAAAPCTRRTVGPVPTPSLPSPSSQTCMERLEASLSRLSMAAAAQRSPPSTRSSLGTTAAPACGSVSEAFQNARACRHPRRYSCSEVGDEEEAPPLAGLSAPTILAAVAAQRSLAMPSRKKVSAEQVHCGRREGWPAATEEAASGEDEKMYMEEEKQLDRGGVRRYTADRESPPVVSLPQCMLELCEDLFSTEAVVESDEAVLEAEAHVEERIMEALSLWQDGVAASDSPDQSRRASGLVVETKATPAREVPRGTPLGGDGIGAATASATTASVSGTQRVQQDLDEIREGVQFLADLHAELHQVEELHRGLQRRYVVEKVPSAAVEDLQARLETAQAALRDLKSSSAVPDGRSGEPRGYCAHPAGRLPNGLLADTVDAVEESQAVCRQLVDQLRSRSERMCDRLTDELLWMRAEVDRHNWTTVLAATTLTRMDPVTTIVSGRQTSCASESASRRSSTFLPAVEARRSHVLDDNDVNTTPFKTEEDSMIFFHAYLQRSGADTTENEEENSTNGPAEMHTSANAALTMLSDASDRTSFLLRVQVPVFASAVPHPPLDQLTARASRGSSSNASATGIEDGSSGGRDTLSALRTVRGGRGGGRSRTSSGPGCAVGRLCRASGGTPSSAVPGRLSGAGTATTMVSLIASPSRYAFTQLYECCRERLAMMFSRLTTLRARRSEEVAQLQRQQNALDPYDPAADDLASRLEALTRYVAQLDAWLAEVLLVDQELHKKVKMPLDVALQTYGRLRTLLLEVLRQRLEAGERLSGTMAAAVWGAEEKTLSEGDGTGRAATPPPPSASSPQVPFAASSSLQKGFTGASTADVTPRASADFIAVLETLLREQDTALAQELVSVDTSNVSAAEEEAEGTELPRASPTTTTTAKEIPNATGTTALGEGIKGVVKTPSAVVAAAAAAAQGVDETCVSSPAVDSIEDAYPCANSTTAMQANAGADDSVGGDPRSCGSPAEMDVSPRSSTSISTAHQRTGNLAPAAAPPLDSAAMVCVPCSCSSSAAFVSEDSDSEEISGSTRCSAAHSSADVQSRDDRSEDLSDDDEDGGEEAVASRDFSLQSSRQRYALGSEYGLRDGVRAFLSAVVRRAMNFSDSDEEAEDGTTASPVMTPLRAQQGHRRRGRRSSSKPQGKRVRLE